MVHEAERNVADVLAAGVSQQVTQILVWGGLLLGAVIFLFGGVWYYRRRWLQTDDRETGEPWTLDDLRRMKQAGQINDEEYRVLRETIVAAFRGGRDSGDEARGRNSVSPPPPSSEGQDPPAF